MSSTAYRRLNKTDSANALSALVIFAVGQQSLIHFLLFILSTSFVLGVRYKISGAQYLNISGIQYFQALLQLETNTSEEPQKTSSRSSFTD
jgi:HKD family nuclease